MNVPGPAPVPVPLARSGLHGVAGPDRLRLAAPALHQTCPLSHVQDRPIFLPRPAAARPTLPSSVSTRPARICGYLGAYLRFDLDSAPVQA